MAVFIKRGLILNMWTELRVLCLKEKEKRRGQAFRRDEGLSKDKAS
jgi:hypothetical protein